MPSCATCRRGHLARCQRSSRYLETPGVTDLRWVGDQLTARRVVSYERAAAIEAYLLRAFATISTCRLPVRVVDVADYFLFDLQRGYCDYYTTSFVVLARAAGCRRALRRALRRGWDRRQPATGSSPKPRRTSGRRFIS